jgi:hypothetical protein
LILGEPVEEPRTPVPTSASTSTLWDPLVEQVRSLDEQRERILCHRRRNARSSSPLRRGSRSTGGLTAVSQHDVDTGYHLGNFRKPSPPRADRTGGWIIAAELRDNPAEPQYSQ